MLLKKIKLAGFKSFVDPTTIPIPSKLVSVVGPNGCGKSNIIDAVCWVMGESSAKYLRGESLTDVIFNGSSARKPVGQASVELVFDNQDGSIGGEYASYAEISIRRVINRESESSYYLNGTRCRRRDIIDIFLGTGLGPRSYSIIGQNMISRIIEAKPDDMRVYLEEAAGVSKYKERRRETENRITHAKENLARLNDIRAELEKQLATLKRQSSAAEKFKLLKQEERNTRARWLAAQWRQLDARLVQFSLQIQQQETGLEAKQTELGHTHLELEQRRESQRLAGESFQDVQRRYYTAGNDIARIEQDIRHTQERQRQWQHDVDQVERDWQEAKNTLDDMEMDLQDIIQECQKLEPELQDALTIANSVSEELEHAEDSMQSWQTQWDSFNQRTAKTTQTAQVEQTRIAHLEQQITTIQQRQTNIEQEQKQLDFAHIEQEMGKLDLDITHANTAFQQHKNQLSEVNTIIADLQTNQQRVSQKLDQTRNTLQRSRGQQASLEALQQTALGQRNQPITQWLSKYQLDKKPRLAQGVEVADGWDVAVEKALGAHLQAVCVDQLSTITPYIHELKQGSLCVFTTHHAKNASHSAGTLLSKVKSQYALDSLLTGIYIAETVEEAETLCQKLGDHESVITRDGVWLSPGWLRVSREENPAAGVFQREQELKQLAQHIAELVETQATLENELTLIREKLKDTEKQRNECQNTVNQSHAEAARLEAQRKMLQERLSEFKTRAERYQQEQQVSVQQIAEAQTNLRKARELWQTALSELEHVAEQREKLSSERERIRENLHKKRDEVNLAKDKAHQLEIRIQTAKSQQTAMQQTITRIQAQLNALTERKTTLQKDFHVGAPLADLEATLADALSRRLHIENELNSARSAIEAIEFELRNLENFRQSAEREVAKIRDMLETLRLESQSLKVKNETLLEQLKETNFQLEEILKDLTEESTAEEWHQLLEQITQRIARLGPINLVAIEEHATCEERKQYLDKQNDDLQEGLNTLEAAIAKIDKETRARFKETFDKVNEQFITLFPQIFGGGRAYLELTGENLLDAGITVMACPPGKRNSTIHLLSGGEKAMTAIALVFSIFHLNPAPFCLLDEVDAPLDDANIGRYCQLVKSMSEKTQFIFISHNKLAIEMGEHLMGVTMNEPGVSRLVSVNMEEAITLASIT